MVPKMIFKKCIRKRGSCGSFGIEKRAKYDDGRFFRSRHGIRLGWCNKSAHVRTHQPKIRVLGEEFVELLFEGSRRRLARAELVKNDFEYFRLHIVVENAFDTRLCHRRRSARLKVFEHQES